MLNPFDEYGFQGSVAEAMIQSYRSGETSVDLMKEKAREWHAVGSSDLASLFEQTYTSKP